MPTLIVLLTNSTEDVLFMHLVERDRHADIPFYFSVDRHDWENGRVDFVRLDCAPAPQFRVAIAGARIITTEDGVHELQSWLEEWRISFSKEREFPFTKPDEAKQFVTRLRSEAMTADERRALGPKVQRELKMHAEKVDASIIAAIEADKIMRR